MIIAVDFDGTLFEDDYPNVGRPIWNTINFCKKAQQNGDILILWTCRADQDLIEAIEACANVGLKLDYINENSKEHIAMFGSRESRKIYADLYIDDKSVNLTKNSFRRY